MGENGEIFRFLWYFEKGLMGSYDSGFSNFSKKWVKMVKLFDFYGILWYFEKGLEGSLWVDLGHR